MTQLPAHVQEYIDSIESVDYFSGSGPLPEGCKLYKTRDAAWAAAKGAEWDAEWDAALDAEWAAAWDAAGDAAGDAAWDAAWDAARTPARDAAGDAEWDAALDAAWAAAGDAAWDAAWTAARDAAGDAAGDAARTAECLLMRDHIAPEHLAYALMRWAIWVAGYGVAVEVDGVHYCYRRP